MPRGVPNAKDTPVIAPKPELHTADLPTAQAPALQAATMQDRGEVIVPVDKTPNKAYLDQLAFNEELLTIRIERGTEEFAPTVVDCWVNGEGAEVMDHASGKLIKLRCLPIGQPIITKRKYVEVLARSRTDRYRGREEDSNPRENEDGWKIKANTTQTNAFSVIHDPSGARGTEWLTRIYAER